MIKRVTLKIPQSLSEKYDGSGYALAAVSTTGEIVDFCYCRKIDDSIDEDCSPEDMAYSIMDNPRVMEHGKFFEIEGMSRMAFGMISCWEFCEL